MEFQKEVKYDTDTVIKAGKAYVFRKHWQDIILSPIVLIYLISRVVYGESNNILLGVLLSVSTIYFMVAYWLYFVNPYRSAAAWKKSGLCEVVWSFADNGIETKSEIGTTKQEWSKIKLLMVTKNYWFLVYKSSAHSSIPIDGFNDAQKEFIKTKVAASGSRVV